MKKTTTRIILAEDETGLRTVLEMMLEETYEVFATDNGRSAWNLVDGSSEPCLVLTDQQMPELDGSVLLRKICDTGVSIRGAILMSGDLTLESEIDQLRAGFQARDIPFAYLVKPFTPNQLRACLDWVEREKSRRIA
jgi:DNA-binding NtrC family response regulator